MKSTTYKCTCNKNGNIVTYIVLIYNRHFVSYLANVNDVDSRMKNVIVQGILNILLEYNTGVKEKLRWTFRVHYCVQETENAFDKNAVAVFSDITVKNEVADKI